MFVNLHIVRCPGEVFIWIIFNSRTILTVLHILTSNEKNLSGCWTKVCFYNINKWYKSRYSFLSVQSTSVKTMLAVVLLFFFPFSRMHTSLQLCTNTVWLFSHKAGWLKSGWWISSVIATCCRTFLRRFSF